MRGRENYRTKRNTALFFFSFLKELLKKVRSYFFPHSMGILTDNTIMRYLLSELFAYFTVSFLFFFMVFFVNQILLLAESILQKHVPLPDVIRLIAYCLPFIIAQSAPFATLVGFLMCLGRMMSANEILIMRASGFGFKMIIKPVLFLGLAISLVSFFVNDYLLPLGTINYTKLYRNILRSNPSIEIEPFSVKRTNDSTFVIGNVEGDEISDMVVFDVDKEGRQRIIIAEKSRLEKGIQNSVIMQMNMQNAKMLLPEKNKKKSFDFLKAVSLTLNVFESSFFEQENGVSPREMTSWDLYQQIEDLKQAESTPRQKLNQYRLEFNKKFSVPFGSLFFAFLAMPLAILFGKHNGQTIGLIIGIFISVLYWAFMILGQIFASRSGQGAVISMWLPNLAVAFFALIFYTLLRRR